jgi:hypothetical protein
MKVLTDIKKKNNNKNKKEEISTSSFSSCLDQARHIFLYSLKRRNLLMRGNLSSLGTTHLL